jgi:prophage regulatory protein
MMTRRTSKAPEAKAAAERPIPEDPFVSGPRPAQALALILPPPPPQAALGEPVAALLYLQDLPPDKLLTIEQVLTLIPISISTWRRGVKSGRFPRGVRLSIRSVFWRIDVIRALLQSP